MDQSNHLKGDWGHQGSNPGLPHYMWVCLPLHYDFVTIGEQLVYGGQSYMADTHISSPLTTGKPLQLIPQSYIA